MSTLRRSPLACREAVQELSPISCVWRVLLTRKGSPAPLKEPPATLQSLLTSENRSSARFREDIWKYNRAFAFTSVGVSEDHSVNRGNGPPVFRISGELHHRSGALSTPDGHLPRYAQVYVHEPRAALDFRVRQNADLDPQILLSLQTMLASSHPYVEVYKHAHEVLKDYDPADDAQIRLRLAPGHDPRRYNLPSADEVAVILPDNEAGTHPRDIILRLRHGPLKRISELHASYAPLQYPLLFPHGEPGWYPEMTLFGQRTERVGRRNQRQEHENEEEEGADPETADSRRLTITRHAAYLLHFRPTVFNTLLHGGRLLTRYVVDIFAAADQMRLRWLEKNQDKFRAARFNNLEDAAADEPDNLDINDIGQRVFLPSSYTGGPRYMHQCYQDSMAIARYYRKVDLFLTMTTNPQWPEILQALLPGQTAYDRPDLVARVFQLKKEALLNYITKHGIFGMTVAHVYTIEFQKRGLPHMHLLIFLDEPFKLLTPEAIDICIWARWPDPETQPLLFETVKKCMVHGPCGAENPSSPCMVDGKCSKGYPKSYTESTMMDGSGYPHYYRPDDGRAYEVNGKMVDNRWIVPFPPFLLALFNCHLNMEVAVSLASFKYISKYIQKGPDRGLLEIDLKNEVKRWRDGRYISAPDAAWRIFHFKTHEQVPNVVRLQVHLPNQHMVTFNPNLDLQTILDRGARSETTLTAYFKANSDPGPLGNEARRHTYQEFPRFFVYNKSQHKWTLRQRSRSALGRMYFIKPTAGELYYLRTLLTIVKGATSFEDLRRAPGHAQPLPTFHAACLARGLLEDDGEWRICLQEASLMQTGTRLRQLFATLLLFTDVSQPAILWNDFQEHICDDLEHRIRGLGINNPTPDKIYDYGLFLLDKLLQDSGRSLRDWPSMPQVQQDWTGRTENSLIAEQLSYDCDAEHRELESRLPRLNQDQRAAYDQIIASVDGDEGQLFFMSGPGGAGKTFVYNTVCSKLRSEGDIILCVSSSGISALLIRGGRTAYSTFKIPIDGLNERSVCPIPKNSARADLFRATKAIIWDEIGAQHWLAVEAVDRTLRDIRGVDQLFGGLTVVLGGDFLQTLPVVPRGSRSDIVNATIQCSHLWQHLKVLHLRKNMRLNAAHADAQQFAKWLLDIGHGRNFVAGSNIQVLLPPEMTVPDIDALITSIYPGMPLLALLVLKADLL